MAKFWKLLIGISVLLSFNIIAGLINPIILLVTMFISILGLIFLVVELE